MRYFSILVLILLTQTGVCSLTSKLNIQVSEDTKNFIFNVKSNNSQKVKLIFTTPHQLEFNLIKGKERFSYKLLDIKFVNGELISGSTKRKILVYTLLPGKADRLVVIPKERFVRNLAGKSANKFINDNVTMPSLASIKKHGFNLTVKLKVEAIKRVKETQQIETEL